MSVVSKTTTTARKIATKRRQVFKHALEKPYTTTWPAADPAIQAEVVDALCDALRPLGMYFAEIRRRSKQECRRKRRAMLSAKRKAKKHNGSAEDGSVPVTETSQTNEPSKNKAKTKTKNPGADDATVQTGQDILRQVVIGINSTTRELERQARAGAAYEQRLVLVVVCKGDVDAQMVAHFPGLAHAARAATEGSSSSGSSNGAKLPAEGLRLVGVGRDSEKKLAAAVGQSRVSAVGIRAGSPLFKDIVQRVVQSVPPPAVPWIGAGTSEVPRCTIYPMSVRELHTTAPILSKQKGCQQTRETRKDEDSMSTAAKRARQETADAPASAQSQKDSSQGIGNKQGGQQVKAAKKAKNM
ncbi:hypothetical protein GQ54DRAFT_297929 [Martensiomyces pterosporus]|nr:hypothetical protein GQ54DRAFT_297929 [Martensiomyces pterosporus]